MTSPNIPPSRSGTPHQFNQSFQQRGRQLSMWLKVWAELDLSDVPQLTGHGTVTVSADLNLNPAVAATANIEARPGKRTKLDQPRPTVRHRQ